MTEYKVMAKAKYEKRYHCYGYWKDARTADKQAENLSRDSWTKNVKVIVTDSNGITNELQYK